MPIRKPYLSQPEIIVLEWSSIRSMRLALYKMLVPKTMTRVANRYSVRTCMYNLTLRCFIQKFSYLLLRFQLYLATCLFPLSVPTFCYI